MNHDTRINLAYYLCQRFYCQPTGRELSCILDLPRSSNNLAALVEWINQLYFTERGNDLLWWERRLQRQLESKGYQL
jgi:hypothetical protein